MSEQCEVLSDLLDEQQVADRLGRSAQSVALWRRHRGLPYVRIPGSGRDTIRYRWPAVLQWAKTCGIAGLEIPKVGTKHKRLRVVVA